MVHTSNIKRSIAPTAHRSSLTAPDLLGAVSTAPTLPVCADSGVTEGALGHAPTNHYAAYAVRNGNGLTMASAITTVSVTNTNSIRITIPAAFRFTDSDVSYEIFFAAATPPLHVSSFTAAQLVAGATARCFDFTTVETPVVSGAGGAAWTCDIGIVGTAVPTTQQRFMQSNALTLGTVTPVNCAGYNSADVFVDAKITDISLATAPSLVLIPVFLNDAQGTNYHVGAPITVNLEQAVGQSKRQLFNLTVNSAYVAILVASIANVTVNRIDVTPTSVV